ncbi:MAG: hypothetical protein K6G25_04795 [Bacteroidales bacterium]|nr:hypothetical protein [Bacteroidales bacterium]
MKGLTESDFITPYEPFGERKTLKYKLIDPYCLFFLRFLDGQTKLDPQYWQKNNNSPRLNSWRGYAFEELCFYHIQQIKKKLGISGVTTTESSWIVYSQEQKTQAQIDMLIDRSDHIVNLCEMKYYNKPFVIDSAYEKELRERVQTLADTIPRRKTVHLTLIAAYGLKQNEFSSQVQSVVTLDDLFAPAF